MSTVCQWSFDLQGLKRTLTNSIMGLALFAGVVSVANCGRGCKPVQSGAEVEAAYTAELVSCSVHAKTKAEASACRKAVNTKYGLCEQSTYPRITPCDEVQR